jgi:hypothetical protein
LWIFTYKLPANKSAACVEFNRIILENVPLSAPKVKPRGVKSIKNILNQLRAQLKGGFLTICEVLLLPLFINKKLDYTHNNQALMVCPFKRIHKKNCRLETSSRQ